MVGEPVTCIFILDHSIYYSIETPNLMVVDSSKEGSYVTENSGQLDSTFLSIHHRG